MKVGSAWEATQEDIFLQDMFGNSLIFHKREPYVGLSQSYGNLAYIFVMAGKSLGVYLTNTKGYLASNFDILRHSNEDMF